MIKSKTKKCCMCHKEFEAKLGIDGLPIFTKCSNCRKRSKRIGSITKSCRLI